jgi:hypothetical protein
MRIVRLARRALCIGCLSISVLLGAMMVVNIKWIFVAYSGRVMLSVADGGMTLWWCARSWGAGGEYWIEAPRHRYWFRFWPSEYRDSTLNCLIIWLPDWVIILPTAALASALARPELRAWRRRRRGETRCVKCGYDRRGLPGAEAACPECGTVPTHSTPAPHR